ncbi:MAG: putative lipid II flippase FtsW [Acidobacteria bacterium]|nr:putative lipid II flippase FtsW [Acidobacteriota bacterium]
MAPDVRRPIDRALLFFALMLLAVGLVWVYSASGVRSPTSTSFLLRQMVGGGIGLALMLALSQTELGFLRDNPRPLQALYIVSVLLLFAVFFFPKVNNAHRWIRIMGQQFQPSEVFKPVMVLVVAWWMVRHQEAWTQRQDAIPKLLTLVGILVVPAALILREPDFGTTFLLLFVALLLVFMGGAPKWIFVIAVPVLCAVGAAFILTSPYRLARVTSFLNPEQDPLGKGHQALQSLVAVGNGGLMGVGLGGGHQKLFFLPEAHTDFIYAVIAEEAGLVGTVAILLLYLGILWRGYRIARGVRDGFLKLSALGLTLLLVVQALMNISVVLSLAPNKGIPLPFISYGGTSLIVSLAVLGLLLSISKETG